MKPITQKVHSRKGSASKLCSACYQPVAQGCGCRSRGPLKKMTYSNPIQKQSCKY